MLTPIILAAFAWTTPGGGTSLTTAANNAALINAYLAGNWRSSKLPLFFPGAGWLTSQPIDMTTMSGQALLGAGGEVLSRPEIHFSPTNLLGGAVSRLVAANRAYVSADDPGGANFANGPLLRIRSYGPKLDGLVLQGMWHPTDLNVFTQYPPPASNDHRCALGIEVENNNPAFGQGVGKLASPSTLTVLHCKTAIKCLDTPVYPPNPEDNADQIILQRFVPYGCDTGLWSINNQSVGHRIGYLDQTNCHTALKFEAGGKLWCGTLSMSSNAQIGLAITGIDADVSSDSGSFFIDNMIVDGIRTSGNDDRQVLNITPPGGAYTAATVNIYFLHVSAARAAATPRFPLLEINRLYGKVNIYGGLNLYERMIKVTGGTETVFPTIRLHNAHFARSQNPTNIFTTDSSGYVQYEQHSCCEFDGTSNPPAAVNAGLMFPAFNGLMNLSVVPPIVRGGYIYHANAVITPSGNYSPTSLDRSILVIGTPANINLPTAASVRGIIYHIKNTLLVGNVTVVAAGGDQIDNGASITLTPGAGSRVVSDGLNDWYVV